MAADYAPSLPETTRFFRFIQNKLHFAVTGKTAAELMAERASAAAPNMGLTSWKAGSVQKGDVTTAKNYLHEAEIGELNRIVTMWLDFAEDQARRRKEVFLKDWAERLDAFLRFNEREALEGAGRVAKKEADEHALAEYEAFAAQRRARLEAEGAEASVRTWRRRRRPCLRRASQGESADNSWPSGLVQVGAAGGVLGAEPALSCRFRNASSSGSRCCRTTPQTMLLSTLA